MHRTVLSLLRCTAPGVFPARLRSGRHISIVCAFTSDQTAPIWVAKTAIDGLGRAGLRREYEALRYLAPWSDELCIPTVIAWDDGDRESCLVQSGVRGTVDLPTIPTDRSTPVVPDIFEKAAAWLRRFRGLVPVPIALSISGLVERLSEAFEPDEAADGEFAALLEFLQRSIPNESSPGVPAHGDFWAPNIMSSRTAIGVIDWGGFATSFPLLDLFWFVGGHLYTRLGRLCTTAEAHCYAFFSRSSVRDFVQRELTDSAFTPSETRFYFYCYLAERIRCQTPARPVEWCGLLQRLRTNGYPGPYTSGIASSDC